MKKCSRDDLYKMAGARIGTTGLSLVLEGERTFITVTVLPTAEGFDVIIRSLLGGRLSAHLESEREANLVYVGEGTGSAYRSGSGDGFVARLGGIGGAIHYGSGDGDAIKWTDATDDGESDDDFNIVSRQGSGSGDAYLDGRKL